MDTSTQTNDAPQPVTEPAKLCIGDLLYRRKSLVMHVGLYLGNGMVLHNSPKNGEELIDYDTFAAEKPVYAKPSHLDAEQVLAKATEVLAHPGQYRLFKNNCEHTVGGVVDGHKFSHQLSEIEAWALIGGAFGKSFGRKSMYIGGFIGALGGLLSLPRLWWTR